MNCPMTVLEVPDSRLLPLLHERNLDDVRVIHYQGSVGPDHYLDQIVMSMKSWPSDAIFVIVGGGDNEFTAHLRSLAHSLGVQDRLVLVGRVPYHEVMSYAVGATLGVTLLEPTIDNQRFCAGASNKRFEYAALGIAQIANADPGMDEIFGSPGLAELLSVINVETIGEAVVRLLSSRSLTAAMGERARFAHLRENNYEAQFAPVLRTIESWQPIQS
jgi:glycosyltransferase involved in cell wall biosynthesis